MLPPIHLRPVAFHQALKMVRSQPQPWGAADRSPNPASQFQTTDPYAQSLEPILFPKLRIYFADFPYLHYSIGQRLLTLETWCGDEYDLTQK